MIRRLALPVAATLLLAACGGGDDASNEGGSTSATTAAPAANGDLDAATGSNAALQFSAPLVGGGQIDLSELGDKPVLLWFWAPW